MRMNLGSILNPKRKRRTPQLQRIISRRIGQAIAGLILAGVAALFGLKKFDSTIQSKSYDKQQVDISQGSTSDINFKILDAIERSKRLPFVEIKNVEVIKLLRDDNKGSRHQRWIVKLNRGIDLTIIYNLDLADKVPLFSGDIIDAAGELIYGTYGNTFADPILHWTHEDPKNKRKDGYVLHRGKRYGSLKFSEKN